MNEEPKCDAGGDETDDAWSTPKGPITGFHLTVTSDELEAHFKKRLGHHEVALEKLGSNVIHLVGKGGDESQIIGKHKEQVRLLRYLVAHLPAGDTFLLTMQELHGLMILDSLVDE